MILTQFNVLLAPFMPHLSESFNMLIYNLGNNSEQYHSVHLKTIDINTILNTKLDDNVLNGFYSIIELLETVRNLRQQANKPIYYPLNFLELYTDSQMVSDYSNVICKELNIKTLKVYSTDLLEKKYKANKGILGKVFKKDAGKYVNMIESGNITWDGCSDEYYTFDYIVCEKPSMLDTKFTYLNKDGKQYQSVVYLDVSTSTTNDNEAEINNIRRQINSLRKTMGLKMFNKVEIVFESNEYWNSLGSESLELLMTRLIATIRFTEKITNGNQIETFNGKTLNVIINTL
jgi:valyl-tRNA synthetase